MSAPPSSALAPPAPTNLQREIVARPAWWFVQTPATCGAALLVLRRLARRSGGGRAVYGGAARLAAAGGFVMGLFDVWYWRRAADAVAARAAWEATQRRVGVPEPAPRGVRSDDGRGWVGVLEDDGGAGHGARGAYGAEQRQGHAREEELRDPWALPAEGARRGR